MDPSRTVILTPEIILAATAALHNNKTSSTCSAPEGPTSEVVNSSAVVFLNKDRGHLFNCEDERIRISHHQFGTESFMRSLDKEIIEKDTFDFSELKQTSKSVIITKSSLNLHIPGALRDDNLVISGRYQVVFEKDRTVVKIDNLQSDLELFLIQPHERQTPRLDSSLLEMSQYGRSQVQLVLPSQLIHSSLSMSSKLTNLGIVDRESFVYHQTTLRLLPQVRKQ